MVEFSEAVLKKAKTYLDAAKVVADAKAQGVYWVQGSGPAPYRVRTDASPDTLTATWAECTCPHGQNQEPDVVIGTCSHIVAVFMLLVTGTGESI